MDDKVHTQNRTAKIPSERREDRDREVDKLFQLAYESGATEVGIMKASDVPVEEGLATLCGETPCDAYGLSGNCPPHVSGPEGFRELKQANALCPGISNRYPGSGHVFK